MLDHHPGIRRSRDPRQVFHAGRRPHVPGLCLPGCGRRLLGTNPGHCGRKQRSCHPHRRASGPANARNVAAASTCGEILLFIDADVRIQPSTLEQVAKAFAEDPKLDALHWLLRRRSRRLWFSSSAQYKNLMHCFVHQQASGARAAPLGLAGRRDSGDPYFWTRAALTNATPGLHRGHRAGRALNSRRPLVKALEPSLTVKHLKHWTLMGLLESDIRDRAIPWTLLMLRERHIPNDLNCAADPARFGGASGYRDIVLVFWPLSLAFLAVVITMNWRFNPFLESAEEYFSPSCAVPLHLPYLIYAARHSWRVRAWPHDIAPLPPHPPHWTAHAPFLPHPAEPHLSAPDTPRTPPKPV